MAIQTSGIIRMTDIVNEFGGSTPHAISEYYGADSGVPSSGQIAFSNFYGASDAPTVSLRTHQMQNSLTTSFNLGSVNIGSASSDRVVVVLVSSQRSDPSSSFLRRITSININGTNRLTQVNTLTGGSSVGFGHVGVSSGTTASISATTDNAAKISIAVYSVYGLTNTGADSYSVTESPNATSVSVSASGKGLVFGHLCYYGTSSGGILYNPGGNQSRTFATVNSDGGHVVGWTTGASGSYTVNCNDAGSSQSIQGIAFN